MYCKMLGIGRRGGALLEKKKCMEKLGRACLCNSRSILHFLNSGEKQWWSSYSRHGVRLWGCECGRVDLYMYTVRVQYRYGTSRLLYVLSGTPVRTVQVLVQYKYGKVTM